MYKLLGNTDAAKLSKHVSEYLASGWQLHGDPIIITREDVIHYDRSSQKFIAVIHYQAITKPVETGGES